MPSFLSSLDTSTLSAWRGQLAATGKRLGLRTYLLQHRQELLPRFAAAYRQLRTLPRRLRKAVQRRWRLSLAGVALMVTLQPLSSEAATFTAGTAAELVTAITTANGNGEVDTITLTADITLDKIDNMTYYGPTGLPVVNSTITIVGKGHTIRRDSGAPVFRLLAVNRTGDLTMQDLTLRGGKTVQEGYLNPPGGAILNLGQLTLTGR